MASRQQLQTIAVHNGQETEIANEDDVAPHAEWVGPRFLRDDEGYDADFGRYDFQCEFEDYPDWGRHLWLYAEEFGEPNEVAWLVKKFLKQFRPDQCWSLTWATTCSKLRIGEFSGGAFFVTAEEIKRQDDYQFVGREQAAFEAQKTVGQDDHVVESKAADE